MKVFLTILLILLLLALLFFAMMMPWKKRRPSAFDRKLFAHRGLHDDSLGIPENSLAAFRRAKAFGYGVEFDIQLTKDKKLVVFHDESLERVCGASVNVRDLTYKELRQYRLRGTEARIPLLSDVLDLLGPDTSILCEVKTYGSKTDNTVCRLALPYFQKYGDRMVMESFSPFALIWFRFHAPEVFRGQLACNFFKDPDSVNPFFAFVLKYLLFDFLTAPDFFSYRLSDRNDFAFRLVRKFWDPHVSAWTVRSEKEHRIAERHFDTVIFEGYLPAPLKKK